MINLSNDSADCEQCGIDSAISDTHVFKSQISGKDSIKSFVLIFFLI